MEIKKYNRITKNENNSVRIETTDWETYFGVPFVLGSEQSAIILQIAHTPSETNKCFWLSPFNFVLANNVRIKNKGVKDRVLFNLKDKEDKQKVIKLFESLISKHSFICLKSLGCKLYNTKMIYEVVICDDINEKYPELKTLTPAQVLKNQQVIILNKFFKPREEDLKK